MNADLSASTWEDLHARSARDLYASVPAFAKCGSDPAIAALTVLMTFAQTAITARRQENSVAAHVVIGPKPDADPAILGLARHMEAAITGSACRARNTTPFDPGAWLEQAGYIGLLTRAVNRAIIGSRGIKAFHEAVELWHRRVATISAVRHERRTDRPGWPAICPPWRCERGIHEIVPLTSAAGLVEEGNRLDHCVGGYYQQCRSGAVQILSLRREGTHAATIELTLSGTTADTLSFQVGQFKARRNRRPDDELHDVLRAFLTALNSGAHPIFRTQLTAHRKRMEQEGDYLWSAGALPIAHAREVFPLYLPLLPRGTPADLDGWCKQTGLTAALDRAAALLLRSA